MYNFWQLSQVVTPCTQYTVEIGYTAQQLNAHPGRRRAYTGCTRTSYATHTTRQKKRLSRLHKDRLRYTNKQVKGKAYAPQLRYMHNQVEEEVMAAQGRVTGSTALKLYAQPDIKKDEYIKNVNRRKYHIPSTSSGHAT